MFGENALRYVGPILAHGGIPRHCLPDYFRLLMRHLKRSADANDLLASWRTRRTTFVGIDLPVRRFLLYGGDLGSIGDHRRIENASEQGGRQSVLKSTANRTHRLATSNDRVSKAIRRDARILSNEPLHQHQADQFINGQPDIGTRCWNSRAKATLEGGNPR